MITRTATLMLAALTIGCPKSVVPDSAGDVRVPVRTEAYSKLMTRTDGEPRQGALAVGPDVLELRLRRGDQTRPFLEVPRQTFASGCFRERDYPAPSYMSDEDVSAWWLFSDDENAVAVEFGSHSVFAWFWDSDRDCFVRQPWIRVVEEDEQPPARYYAADDVQVAYRWRQTSNPSDPDGEFRDDGEPVSDVLKEVPGVEQLLVDEKAVTLVRADGRALFHREFEAGGTADCSNSQLSVFETDQGQVYIVVTFEVFSSSTGCAKIDGSSQMWMEFADWDQQRAEFVTTYRTSTASRAANGESPEFKQKSSERLFHVAGGTLRTTTQLETRSQRAVYEACEELDRGSGICLRTVPCRTHVMRQERTTKYVLEPDSGPELKVGEGSFTQEGDYDECPDLEPN